MAHHPRRASIPAIEDLAPPSTAALRTGVPSTAGWRRLMRNEPGQPHRRDKTPDPLKSKTDIDVGSNIVYNRRIRG